MNSFLTVGFLAILIGPTLLAVRMWYTRRGESVSEAARPRFRAVYPRPRCVLAGRHSRVFRGPLLIRDKDESTSGKKAGTNIRKPALRA
jgi:hypothetical protein